MFFGRIYNGQKTNIFVTGNIQINRIKNGMDLKTFTATPSTELTNLFGQIPSLPVICNTTPIGRPITYASNVDTITMYKVSTMDVPSSPIIALFNI